MIVVLCSGNSSLTLLIDRIEEDYSERVKAKSQAAIDRAHQRDEELNARLQSKMPKRVSPPAEAVKLPPSSSAGMQIYYDFDIAERS